MSNFLSSWSEGLKKTSAKMTERLKAVFGGSSLDEQTAEALEELLIESDMGVSASVRIVSALKKRPASDLTDSERIKALLAEEIATILKPCQQPWRIGSEKKPFVILMVGVNGAGKTTTIGKMASRLKAEGKQVSFIAGDTFRAAAVEQLRAWGDRSDIRVFSGTSGCDSAGLCYDGLREALRVGDDVVFIDTAGRLQNNGALMDELKKVIRVIKKLMPEAPHQTLLTLDATTGQNALSQVEIFKKVCDVDGLIVTKVDGSAKGGILTAIAEADPLPVYFVGIGEKIEDLKSFDAQAYARSLLNLPL